MHFSTKGKWVEAAFSFSYEKSNKLFRRIQIVIAIDLK